MTQQGWATPLQANNKRERWCLLVQLDAQGQNVDLKSAVVLDKAQFSKLVHEEIDPQRVVPTNSASASCDIFGRTP
jgi:hypothetical protein